MKKILKVYLEYLEIKEKEYNNNIKFKLSNGFFYYINNNKQRKLYILSSVV